MKKKNGINVSEFAKLSRTTRDTLHYYDKIGILSPLYRGENNYRYYSTGQLAIVNVIRMLQELGMTLTEIKSLVDNRTPEKTSEILTHQIKKIDERINGWVNARKLLLTIRETIQSALCIDENSITIKYVPAEAIILGNINDYSNGRTDYDALTSFYNHMQNIYPNLNLNYPAWGIISKERILLGDWKWTDRYYFYNPEGYDKRPAALYALGYTRGEYGQTDELYKRMADYIDKNDFEISGDAYEEYPLNEFCISDDSNYLIRIMITVREKVRG